MAIVKMKKASLIALQSDKPKIIKELQQFANFQVINLQEKINAGDFEDIICDDDSKKVSQLEAKISQIKYLLEFISKYNTQKKSMFESKKELSQEAFIELINSNEYLSIYENCRRIDDKLNEIKNTQTKLANLELLLKPWSKLDIPVQELRNSEHISISVGIIPSKFTENFKNTIYNELSEIYCDIVSEDRENAYCIIICHISCSEKLQTIMKQYSWSKTVFPEFNGTVMENIKNIQNELVILEKQKENLQSDAKKSVEQKDYIEELYDVNIIEHGKADIIKNIAKTEKTFLISGWLPESLTKEIDNAVKKVTDNYYITFEDPKDNEDFPVLLDNPVLVKPLEMITEQYSLPNPRSLDPNVIMAPFYVMFFGMMVSDAGYGIVLALATAFALFKFRPTGGLKKLLGLLCLGGVSTFVWGALFGGWFGDAIKLPPLWFSPLEDPLFMLVFCLFLGVIQLYVGMGLQAYKSIKAGNVMDAVFDQGFWYLLLTGLIFLAIPQVAFIGKYMAILGATGLVLTQGRTEKNIIKRLLSGVLSLYNVTGFLGDVLSYSRLFALGLATGVIGSVVNSMSSMLAGSIVGYILMIIFLVFGHTFNIAINVLGAYVHASRLQYVEFFGKFFEGDGKPFEPFKVNTKYITFKN